MAPRIAALRDLDKAHLFNLLYWDLLARNRAVASDEPGIAPTHRTRDSMSDERRDNSTAFWDALA